MDVYPHLLTQQRLLTDASATVVGDVEAGFCSLTTSIDIPTTTGLTDELVSFACWTVSFRTASISVGSTTLPCQWCSRAG